MAKLLEFHRFHHRKNPDGSWDSICMRCYLTTGSRPDESSLAVVEELHKCDKGGEELSRVTANARHRSTGSARVLQCRS